MQRNKQKILIKIAELQKLVINDEYINAMTKIDVILTQIRYMTEERMSTLAENERKGGVL